MKSSTSIIALIYPVKDCYAAVIFSVAFVIALWHWDCKRRRRLRCPKSSPSPHRQTLSPPTQSATNTDVRLASKIDFLDRVGESYGYVNSSKGFIDDWRSSEFPSLIPPLQLPSRFHERKQPSGQTNDYCDEPRNKDMTKMDVSLEQEVYLDYAGSAIPTRTLLARISNHSQILANPHSQGGGLASDRTWKLMQLSKDRVMQHFGIQHETFGLEELDKDDDGCPGYQLVFTSGATESLRLIAERFPWSSTKFATKFAATQNSHILQSNAYTVLSQSTNNQASAHISKQLLKSIHSRSILVYSRNVHTSVIGMRQVAIQRGAHFHCASVDELLGATSEWFQNLIKGALSYEYQDAKMHTTEDKDEEKNDELCLHQVVKKCIGQVDNTAEQSTPCKTIWVHHLLVLPLECNFGGDRFDWSNTTAMARESSFSSYLHDSSDHSEQTAATIKVCHKWHVLLDTAKAAATSPVSLPTLSHGGGPDFAVVSFYKMFGAPTGLGALFAKKQGRKQRRGNRVAEKSNKSRESQAIQVSNMTTHSIAKYHLSGGITIERCLSPRHFFGGGSVDVVLQDEDFIVPRNASKTASSTNQVKGSINFEEDEHIDLGVMVHGTEHFRGIANLLHGFQELDNDLGGMEAISSHSTCLAAELVRRLGNLVHDNGKPVVQLYGQWKSFENKSLGIDPSDAMHRYPGPTVAFNICDRDGSPIGYDEISRLATLNCPPIQLRTGCFCNPGACQDAIPLTNADVLNNYGSGHVCGDRRGILNGKPTGAIRSSFGKDSIWEDMDALARFIENVFSSGGYASVPNHNSLEREVDVLDPSITMKVDSLFLFPIKSCAAMRVNRWPIDRRTGRFAFDREFALVDTSGSAMRLHSYPQMSEIHAKVDLNTKVLTVTAPNHEDLFISLENSNSTTGLAPEDIQVCGTLCKGSIWGGSKASRWFSSVLGVRCWLAKAENVTNDDRPYAYCNEASVLLVSQQSISFLNSIITAQGWGKAVDSRHFRPNIVVSRIRDGEESQHVSNPEDYWEKIIIRGSSDELELDAVGKCSRCIMVDIDPISGMKGNTLRALAQYRRDRGKINFGTFFTGNMEAPEGQAWLEEGSEVHTAAITSKGDS